MTFVWVKSCSLYLGLSFHPTVKLEANNTVCALLSPFLTFSLLWTYQICLRRQIKLCLFYASHLFIIKIVTLVVYLIQSWFWLSFVFPANGEISTTDTYCIYSWGLFGAARTLSVEYVAPIRSKTTASDDDGCTPGCTGWSSESGFADTSRPNSIAHDEYAFAVSDTSFDKLSALTHQEIMLNDDVRNEMSINF